MNNYYILLVLVCILSPSRASSTIESPLWFTFPIQSETWRVVLPAPAARRVYNNAMTAVNIRSVTCDGNDITAESSAPAMQPSLGTAAVKSGSVVYQFTLGFLQCWDNINGDPTKVLMRSYTIPFSASVIEIKYNIRYPDGTASEELCANFVANDQPIQQITLSPAVKTAGVIKNGANPRK